MSNLGKRNMFQEGFDPRSNCNCGVLCGAKCYCTCSGTVAKVNNGLKKGVANNPAEVERSPGELV